MAVAALAAGATASAQSDRPTPTSCAGLTFEDPAGDQELTFAGGTIAGQPVNVGPPDRPKDNLDLIAGFLRYAPSKSGGNTMTAVLQVTNLTKELMENSTGAAWYFYFNVGDVVRYVSANLDSEGAVTYDYGTKTGNNNLGDGDTTGRFLEGPKGMIEIVVPVADMDLEGQTLTEVIGEARVAYQAQGRGVVAPADRGPDEGAGEDFTVEPCAAEGSTTTATKSPTPANDQPKGGGGGSGGSGGGTTGGGDSTTPGAQVGGGVQALKLRVRAGRISARRSRRKLSVRLLPGETIRALRATLYTGKASRPRVFATGRIATLKKARKLTLKVKRKLKKGTYTLALTGRNAAGQTSTVAVRLRVRA